MWVALLGVNHARGAVIARASAPGLTDGAFQLFIGRDNVSSFTLADDFAELDFVGLGALRVKVGANGTLQWDEFESRR